MSLTAAPSIAIKVPVHAVKPRAAPPVAARLQARTFPARHPTSSEAIARKELLAASHKARVSANAASHNARVSDVHDATALVESQVKQYRRSSIDRRLQEASELRSKHLSEKKQKASAVSLRAAAVESRAAARRASVAAKVERKLESAAEVRRRRLDAITFRASDATARIKSVALSQKKEQTERLTQMNDKLREAQQRREAYTNRVALKASLFVLRVARAAVHAEADAKATAAETKARLTSRLANAEQLKELDVRLRQCKARLVVERASHVVARRRLSDSVKPVLGAAKLKAQLARAQSRRESVMNAVAVKARHFVRRAVVTCATAEVRQARNSVEKKASLDARLAGANSRKKMFLELGARGLGHPLGGGGPSPPSAGRFARDSQGRLKSATQELAARFAQTADRPSTSRGVQTTRIDTASVVV